MSIFLSFSPVPFVFPWLNKSLLNCVWLFYHLFYMDYALSREFKPSTFHLSKPWDLVPRSLFTSARCNFVVFPQSTLSVHAVSMTHFSFFITSHTFSSLFAQRYTVIKSELKETLEDFFFFLLSLSAGINSRVCLVDDLLCQLFEPPLQPTVASLHGAAHSTLAI